MIQQLFLHGKRIRRERKKYLWNGKLNKTGQNITNHIEKRGKRDTVKKGEGNLCIEKTLLS